jgi:CsoR family transcriptional regulator, copper-sensing transcriptional repressor
MLAERGQYEQAEREYRDVLAVEMRVLGPDHPDTRAHAIPCGGINRIGAAWSEMYGYTQNKDDYLKRLRRIEGQVRGLQRMIDEDQYCIDILTQVAATTKALQSVAIGLLEEHLGHCVAQAVAEGGDTASEKVREASEAIARLVRS